MLGGVCGGIASYLGVDPTFVRIAFVLFTVVCGVGVPVYLAMWVIVPRERPEPQFQASISPLMVRVAIVVALTLVVASIDPRALPWLWIAGGVALIVESRRTRRRDAVLAVQSVDLDAESEVVWCRRFNLAMARKGDPTRISPAGPTCPSCGAATGRVAFCGRCGTRIQTYVRNPL